MCVCACVPHLILGPPTVALKLRYFFVEKRAVAGLRVDGEGHALIEPQLLLCKP